MSRRLIQFYLIDFLIAVVEDNQEAPEIQDVRLVVRQGGRPLEPILSNDERLSFPKKPISSRLGLYLL